MPHFLTTRSSSLGAVLRSELLGASCTTVIHVEEYQHLQGRVHNLAADMEGHLEAMHTFGLARLDDLVGQVVHEDVEQKGGEGAALPHTSADAEPLQRGPLPCHPHPVALVEVLDEAYQLGVDARQKALLKSTEAACMGVAVLPQWASMLMRLPRPLKTACVHASLHSAAASPARHTASPARHTAT